MSNLRAFDKLLSYFAAYTKFGVLIWLHERRLDFTRDKTRLYQNLICNQ